MVQGVSVTPAAQWVKSQYGSSCPTLVARVGVEHLASTPAPGHARGVTQTVSPTSPDLFALGWSATFADQVDDAETALWPVRIATVHRARLTVETTDGPMPMNLPVHARTTDFAVGDWALMDAPTQTMIRRLDRHSLLERRTEGGRGPHLIAANVDTLFIVSSCNDDMNPARLERYLALANDAGTTPVVVLTKADMVADPEPYRQAVLVLQRDLQVVLVNAHSEQAADVLKPWCGRGQTVALVGSSGVGKSSLLNTLAAKSRDDAQLTGPIRAADAKGRHTTTARSLHRIAGGGWVIDTPGIRSLQISDNVAGLDVLFAEIVELAPLCKFRNCTHVHEPGCAVLAAVASGALDAERVARWRKLGDENRANTPVLSGPSGNKSVKPANHRR